MSQDAPTGSTPPATTPGDAGGSTAPEETHQDSRLLGRSAVMAAGTVVSRASGLVRAALLVAAIGSLQHADVFNVANTIPNALYILLAGGVFNAVLVPQLVRALRNDADGGEAYTNRIITAFGLFLAGVTVALVVAAPWVVQLYARGYPPQAQQSLVAFTRYCVPQIFFYGMFVLVGQVLNARGRFGPMMWAPIANNVVSVAVLVGYLVAFGSYDDALDACTGYSTSQELVLGLGSTLGIVVQCAILVPYLRRAGYTYRPRFDLRGTGLGHTARLGVWTLLFVLVNQVAYIVVVNLASSGTTGCGATAQADATGYTIYSQSFLLVMVPHSVVTVSLATALLPLLSARAAAGDLSGLARSLASTLRTALAVIVPVAALLPVVAPDVARLVFGHGAGSATADNYGPTLALFGIAFVAFTVHYLVLRGFYALERNRTVFFIQCAVAATNIALAVVLVGRTDAADTAPSLVVAYGGAYLVGALISYTVLRRLLGGLQTPALLGFLARLLAAAVVALGAALLLREVLPDPGTGQVLALLRLVAVGLVDVAVFLAVALLLRLDEVGAVVSLLAGRLIPSRGGRHRSRL